MAFIDESYREPLRSNERPFYTMSAVIVGPTQGELIRDVLMDIPGSRYWHTTEAYRTEPGKRVIAEMIDYLAEAVDYNIITVQTEISREDPGMHQAREESLSALAKEVTRGQGDGAVRLLVAESRNKKFHPDGDNADARNIKRMRSAGTLNRSVHIHHIPREGTSAVGRGFVRVGLPASNRRGGQKMVCSVGRYFNGASCQRRRCVR